MPSCGFAFIARFYLVCAPGQSSRRAVHDLGIIMPKKNPLKLNNLQLKTLTVLQALAETDLATTDAETGKVTISSLPNPHGNHFHIGDRVVQLGRATCRERVCQSV